MDQELHGCATKLITEFFKKTSKSTPSSISSVKVLKQYKNIDVICIINEIYWILIEDKTGTKNHSNQLDRYLIEVEKSGIKRENILPIYFKTEDQSNYNDVVSSGYEPFLRPDFLTILNGYPGQNNILIDYRNRLKDITTKTESYLSLPPEKWSRRSWVGFYQRLQIELGTGNWDYVANPSGGFLGFWWNSQGPSDCRQYIQIEENTLCIKIKVIEKNRRRELRSKWSKLTINKAKDFGFKLTRPRRFGSGKFMTVSIYKDYREFTDGSINISNTLSKLKNAEDILHDLESIV